MNERINYLYLYYLLNGSFSFTYESLKLDNLLTSTLFFHYRHYVLLDPLPFNLIILSLTSRLPSCDLSSVYYVDLRNK